MSEILTKNILSNLKPPKGAIKNPKRVGRGLGSGHGKTSGRGTKGHNARTGGGSPPGFEGGQMPLQRRIPKRGFVNIFRKEYAVLNVGTLERFESNSTINPKLLKERRIVKNIKDGVKILGEGKLSKPLVVQAHKFSNGAKQKIEAVGGKAEVIKNPNIKMTN